MLNNSEIIGITIVSVFIMIIIGVFKCIQLLRTDHDHSDRNDHYNKMDDDNQHTIYNYIHNSENNHLENNNAEFHFSNRNSV